MAGSFRRGRVAVILLVAAASSLSSPRSFVGAAVLPPLPQQPKDGDSTEEIQSSSALSSQAQDAYVRDLESLKHGLGNTLEMMRSHSSVYADVNGQKEIHQDFRQQVESDGKLVAKVDQHLDAEKPSHHRESSLARIRTDIEIPSEGVHSSTMQDVAQEDASPSEGKSDERKRTTIVGHDDYQGAVTDKLMESSFSTSSYSGGGGNMQYSPMDMAEYVFWTGDEKGVTLGIEEFLREGLMSWEEAIDFLQEIKYNLDYLQNRYAKLGFNLREHFKAKPNSPSNVQILPMKNDVFSSGDGVAQQQEHLTQHGPPLPHPRSLRDDAYVEQELPAAKKNSYRATTEEKSSRESNDVEKRRVDRNDVDDADGDEYEELLERLRLADFLYTEYSLEEVIYQLAKVMFTQSLTRGNAEAQKALQKFTTFLEKEAEKGHISRELEKKVLDVLIASLTDTLSENPELISTARESAMREKQQVLRKILSLDGGQDEQQPEAKAVAAAGGAKQQQHQQIPALFERKYGLS